MQNQMRTTAVCAGKISTYPYCALPSLHRLMHYENEAERLHAYERNRCVCMTIEMVTTRINHPNAIGHDLFD